MLRGLLLVAAQLPLAGPGAQKHVHNGLIVYAHVGGADRSQIYAMTATGTHRHPLTTGRRYSSYDPAFSPNGKQIAFVRANKSPDIWTMRADGTHKRNLTRTTRIDEYSPVWSPDGTQIAFSVEEPAAQQGIWVMGVNGRNRHRLTNGADASPSWSPDASKLAFARSGAIYDLPAAGGTPTQLTFPGSDSDGMAYQDFEPAWSPQGHEILFVSNRGDPAESVDELDLWAMNADGSGIEKLTNTASRDERDPAWSPDGREIVYDGQGSFHGASSSQIYVSGANGVNRRILTHACGDCAYINDEPSWQPLP